MENTFWSIMEYKLNNFKTFGNKNVEVINFGVSGYGTAQELLTLRHRVWDYSPDIVLLAFYTGNDIFNNSKILDPHKLKPFYVFRNEKFELDNSFVAHPTYRWKTGLFWSSLRCLYRYSRTIQLLAKLREINFSDKSNNNDGTNVEFDYLYHTIFIKPINPDWQQAWAITESLIVKIRNEVTEKNARFILVTLSNDIQVHPDPEVRKLFMKQNGINDLFYPDNRIKRLCKKEDIEVLLLSSDFQEYAERNQIFLHGYKNSVPAGFGHWNINAHQLAAEIITEYFYSTKQ